MKGIRAGKVAGKGAPPLGARLELGKSGSIEPLFLGQDRQEIDAKREAYHEAGSKFRRVEKNDVRRVISRRDLIIGRCPVCYIAIADGTTLCQHPSAL